MNVLVIPEDFRHDQYILKPLFKRLFKNMGKANANIDVCRDPLLGGVTEALKTERIQEIVDQYEGMTQIFILCVDRDGVETRRQRLDQIETEFGKSQIEDECVDGQSNIFLAENAWEEIETWVLAGLRLPRDWSWSEVRAEPQVKEIWFDRLVRERGLTDGPGYGRKVLGEMAAKRIATIRQKCPEDFDSLASRLETATA